MTFKQLLQTHTWPTISSLFLEIYPDSAENIKGYEAVFKKLLLIKSGETDMSIVISKEKDDDEEYIDVSGLYNTPKHEEEHYSQGIEFTPWRQWLGMAISTESLANFSEQEIIVHCLYEMTYVGFSEEDIQKEVGRIEKSREDFVSMTAEEKAERTISLEELLSESDEKET